MRRFRPSLWTSPAPVSASPLSLVSYDTDQQATSESFLNFNIGAADTAYVPVVAGYMLDGLSNPVEHYVELAAYGSDSYDRVFGETHAFSFANLRGRISTYYLAPTGSDIVFESDTTIAERYGIAAVLSHPVDLGNLTEDVTYPSASLSVAADSITFGFATDENLATPTSITDMTPIAQEVRPNATDRWFEIAVPEVETGARTVTLGSSGAEAIINLPTATGSSIGLTFEDYYTSPDATPGTITLGSTPSASDEFLLVYVSGWFTGSVSQVFTFDGQTPERLAISTDGDGRKFSLFYVTGVTSSTPVVTISGTPFQHSLAVYKVTGFTKQKVSVKGSGLQSALNLTPEIYCEDGGAVLAACWLRGNPANFSVSGLDTVDVDEVLLESPSYVTFGRLTASDAMAGITLTRDGADDIAAALFFVGS